MIRTIADIIENPISQSTRPLIVDRSGELSHSDVVLLSGQIASKLLDRLDTDDLTGRRVVIVTKLDRETVLLVLALLRLGAVYVPLEVKSPENVVRHVIEDVRPDALIGESGFEPSNLGVPFLLKTELCKPEFSTPVSPVVRVLPTDLAYIAFTSGTTSAPKGVMMPHAPIANFVECVTRTFQHGPGVVSLCRTPPSFDPFLTEVLPSIASGGTIAIQQRMVSTPALLRFVEEFSVSNLGCGPKLLADIVKYRRFVERYDLSGLSEVYVGYENTPIQTLRDFQSLMPWVQVINGYGTTETFAASTFYPIPNPYDADEVPLGDPVEGVGLELADLDTGARILGDGVGELMIRGVGMMRGYFNNAGATDAAMARIPADDDNGDRAYRTGDIVRRDNDRLFFVGRRDNQIKVRGFRVEPEAIAATIRSIAGSSVEECVVMWDGKELICCYVAASDMPLEPIAVTALLLDQLEPYKIPNRWIEVQSIPRNENSKVDLMRLQEAVSK